jgi:hypothetical protein
VLARLLLTEMEYQPQRVWEMLQTIPWNADGAIRLFWIRYTGPGRDDFAHRLRMLSNGDAVVALAVRKNSFISANAVQSDVSELLEDCRSAFESLMNQEINRLTVLLIGREDFRLVHTASEIPLPDWFPLCAGLQRSFEIGDLAQTAEERPLNCPEARLDGVSALLYEFEEALVSRLREIHSTDPDRTRRFIQAIQQNATPPVLDAGPHVDLFERHIRSVSDPRAYRPSTGTDAKYLAAKLLKLALGNSPKQLAVVAAAIAECMPISGSAKVKPSLFAVAWRPAAPLSQEQANWHGILVALFQAYQLMNGGAHAGDYPTYPVALLHASSLDLRKCLTAARLFVEALS